MVENKPKIGLSWEPKLPTSFLPGNKSGSGVKTQSLDEKCVVYKPKSELVDGLYVPTNNPKKLNKLLKKQIKDTSGKNWYGFGFGFGFGFSGY